MYSENVWYRHSDTNMFLKKYSTKFYKTEYSILVKNNFEIQN